MSAERFVPYHTAYSVDDEGNVRSYKSASGAARLLKPTIRSTGYPHVHLDGKQMPVHQIVLLAFVGERPAGQVTRHLDGDKTNNRLSNLAYGTVSENSLDSIQHGTHPEASKAACKNGHAFTPENTLPRVSKQGRVSRRCVACTRQWTRELGERKKANA